MFIIQKGRVRLTYDADTIKTLKMCGLLPDSLECEDHTQSIHEYTVEKTEGGYFGEWVLLGENISSLSAVAIGDVTCAVITKEKFDSAVGPLAKFSLDDHKYVTITIVFMQYFIFKI